MSLEVLREALDGKFQFNMKNVTILDDGAYNFTVDIIRRGIPVERNIIAENTDTDYLEDLVIRYMLKNEYNIRKEAQDKRVDLIEQMESMLEDDIDVDWIDENEESQTGIFNEKIKPVVCGNNWFGNIFYKHIFNTKCPCCAGWRGVLLATIILIGLYVGIT